MNVDNWTQSEKVDVVNAIINGNEFNLPSEPDTPEEAKPEYKPTSANIAEALKRIGEADDQAKVEGEDSEKATFKTSEPTELGSSIVEAIGSILTEEEELEIALKAKLGTGADINAVGDGNLSLHYDNVGDEQTKLEDFKSRIGHNSYLDDDFKDVIHVGNVIEIAKEILND